MWQWRYREINAWERYLTESGTINVKLLLNVSKAQQARRFLARIEEPEKNWKFSPADLRERAFWDDYQNAYQNMLSHTSTRWAPWHVIPSNYKWFSHLSTSAVLLATVRERNPQYPKVDAAAKAELQQAKRELLSKHGDGGPRSK